MEFRDWLIDKLIDGPYCQFSYLNPESHLMLYILSLSLRLRYWNHTAQIAKAFSTVLPQAFLRKLDEYTDNNIGGKFGKENAIFLELKVTVPHAVITSSSSLHTVPNLNNLLETFIFS